MTETRKAHVEDFINLLNLINNMTLKDKVYLGYDKDPPAVIERLLRNVNLGTVVLFVEKPNTLFGFVEYAVQDNAKIWVYSLYYKETHRHHTLGTLTQFFTDLKSSYKLPVHYTVMPGNKSAIAIARFIKAQPVANYFDGRVEYRVEVV